MPFNFEKYNNEIEFKKALESMFLSLDKNVLENKDYISHNIFEKIITPDHVITFDVDWVDDNGNKRVNKGYRVQFNNVNGPYKGGIRFHPSVNLSILKFLAFEQTFKNYLTGLSMGGAKGGSDFDPKGKSDNEIKNFCIAFMKELYPYIGVDKDVPAGDIGVGSKEIETMYLAYKEFSHKSDCALTGKPIYLGGSLVRKEATGYGVTYFAEQALKTYLNESIKGKKVLISGSGNVALYSLEKVNALGGKVIAMSDSESSIYDEDGIDFNLLKDIKENKKGRIKEYALYKKNAKVYSSDALYSFKADLIFPCATQFEIDEKKAQVLIDNGIIGVFEGANMPCSMEAAKLFIENKIIYTPGKASNAGGVSVSGLEIIQNNKNEKWSFEKVDNELKNIMENIFKNIYDMALSLNDPYNLLKGANNYAFVGICNKMLERGE